MTPPSDCNQFQLLANQKDMSNYLRHLVQASFFDLEWREMLKKQISLENIFKTFFIIDILSKKVIFLSPRYSEPSKPKLLVCNRSKIVSFVVLFGTLAVWTDIQHCCLIWAGAHGLGEPHPPVYGVLQGSQPPLLFRLSLCVEVEVPGQQTLDKPAPLPHLSWQSAGTISKLCLFPPTLPAWAR